MAVKLPPGGYWFSNDVKTTLREKITIFVAILAIFARTCLEAYPSKPLIHGQATKCQSKDLCYGSFA